MSFREYLATARAIPLVIVATVVGMFVSVLVIPYAFSDDYPNLWMAISGQSNPYFGRNILDGSAVNGRPFSGVVVDLLFSAAGTIENLRFVRLFSVIGIVVLALLLHWTLMRAGFKPGVAALVSLLICSTPAFQVFSAWAVLAHAPWAGLLGGAASLVTVAAVDGPRELALSRLVAGFALLFAALLTYQPTAMFFWVFLAIALAGSAGDTKRSVRILKAHAGVAVLGLACGFVVVKVGAHLAGGGSAPNASRNHLTHDVFGKLHWFLTKPLYRSLNLVGLTPSAWIGALVAVVAVSGIVLLLGRVNAPRLPFLLVGALLIPLSFLPNLAVSENTPTYRVAASLSALIALYFCLGAIGLWLAAHDWMEGRVSRNALAISGRIVFAVAGVFVAASAYIAARNVTTLIAEPQMTELRLLRGRVAKLPTGVPRVGFVQIAWNQGLRAGFPYSDEFGIASAARPWTGETALRLILREEGRLPPPGAQPVVDPLPWDTQNLPSNEPVIDMRILQTLR